MPFISESTVTVDFNLAPPHGYTTQKIATDPRETIKIHSHGHGSFSEAIHTNWLCNDEEEKISPTFMAVCSVVRRIAASSNVSCAKELLCHIYGVHACQFQ